MLKWGGEREGGREGIGEGGRHYFVVLTAIEEGQRNKEFLVWLKGDDIFVLFSAPFCYFGVVGHTSFARGVCNLPLWWCKA